MELFPLSALQKNRITQGQANFCTEHQTKDPPGAEFVWSHALFWPQISLPKVVFPFLVTKPKSHGFTYNNIK